MTLIKLSILEGIEKTGAIDLQRKMSKKIHDVGIQIMNGIKRIGKESSIHSSVLQKQQDNKCER